ncbi:alpha/beta hydrolase [Priestia megaterium]|nr:alpha/beta hydrolase [Priestia megaterium]
MIKVKTSNTEIIEKELQVPSSIAIQGTFSLPSQLSEKTPAILIISGSGPVDRDGNAKRLKSNIYKDLSGLFCSIGYATFRYDKRNIKEFYKTSLSDLVEDAREAFKTLSEQPEIDSDSIYLAGHSEGCMIASILAAELNVKGVILLSGAGQNLIEAIEYQREAAYQELEQLKGFKGFMIRKLDVIKKDRKKAEKMFHTFKNSEKDIIRFQFMRMNAKWWREHMEIDIQELYENISVPVLAVTGSKDVQADPKALALLPASLHAETRVIENMNHLLKIQDEDTSMLKLMKTYKKGFSLPIAPELKDVLNTWLAMHARGQQECVH